MRTSDSLKEIAPALIAFQSEVKDPRKDSNNPFFKSKYVELDGLMMAVRPVANKHGLYISQDVTTEMTESGKTKVSCKTRLTHSSGEWVESEGQFNIAKGNDPQSIGSSETYIRRYDLSAFCGIAWDKDDDGNSGSFGTPATQAQRNELEVLAQKVGADLPKLLAWVECRDINTLTVTAWQKAIAWLRVKAQKNEGYKVHPSR